ncbi:acyl-CoA--6-aminopenicillanic acid acyl-transferase [Ravibacter arvi]|uniref:Acyl-CoA--6-aminopenicillanic acid acyl-transferase n=1 Tax=Ravibacter arvi TaxID=2051041 RepID=A0ABP8M1I2_9BACT
MQVKSSRRKILFRLLAGLVVCCGGLLVWFHLRTKLETPETGPLPKVGAREKVGPDHYRIGNNWLRKNRFGIWEMYLEGPPLERGLIYGKLARELVNEQEEVFVAQIRNMIPSEIWLKSLKYFVGWFNRDIDQYVQPENLQEIYGISRSFSDQFNFIGEPYYRVLNYHAAHDIGHALTDLNMVGCTSFAANHELSADSTLMIGRNFDFNMGDRFAENKLVLFLKPEKGYALASVTWAGFTGVVSGMNEKGLTVTLNAAKSDIPYQAKTPISLLAREILQYAANISEAIAIAAKRETFVSESLLIGSAEDGKAVVIEKTPSKMDVYDSKASLTVCSNHYQGPTLSRDPANLENIRESDSEYRFRRMRQLIDRNLPLTPGKSASILRDQLGMDDKFLGYGNPKAINQLLAHHAVLFKPAHRKMWVSANPYQLGAFVSYDLGKVFTPVTYVTDSTGLLPADPFLVSAGYKHFESFKKTRNRITSHLMTGKPLVLSDREISDFIAANPESYAPYELLGAYFRQQKKYPEAAGYFRKALTKELPSEKDRKTLTRKLEDALAEVK